MPAHLPDLKVVVFDTFGTVVDWRGSIVADLTPWGARLGIHADWAGLADAWRRQYDPQKARVMRGEIPWTNLDDLHRESLQSLLSDFQLQGLDASQVDHVNRVWHRLKPWPDALEGLARIRRQCTIGPLSNGNVALLVNMARRAGLPWDMVFSCELFRHYKPHPATYRGVAELMGVAPREVMLCAAHNNDLRGARDAGLMTAFIPRPTEHGPLQTTDLAAEESWDIVADDLVGVAEKMGL